MLDERLKHIVPKFVDDLADIKKRWGDMTLNQRMNEIAHLFDNVRVGGFSRERFLEEVSKVFDDVSSQSAIRLWVDTLIMHGPDFLKHVSGDLSDNLPLSFDALDKKWASLSDSQKVLAIGRLWEAKKEIISYKGEKVGYSADEFVTTASEIIGADREVIKGILEQYMHKSTDGQTSGKSNGGADGRKQKRMSTRISIAKKGESPTRKSGAKSGRPRKQTEETKPVQLTPDRIKMINDAFAKRDGLKRVINPSKIKTR